MKNVKKIVVTIFAFVGIVVDLVAFFKLLPTGNTKYGVLLALGILNIFLIALLIVGVIRLFCIKKNCVVIVDGIELQTIGYKNLTRKLNRDVIVEEISYEYLIENGGFELDMSFSGSVRKRTGSLKGVVLNCSGDSNTSVSHLDAYSYNKKRNSRKKRELRAQLIGPDSLNKQLLFPFSKPLRRNDTFSYGYHYRWNNCVGEEKDYVVAYPAFKYIKAKVINLVIKFRNYNVSRLTVYSMRNGTLKNEQNLTLVKDETDRKEKLFSGAVPIDNDLQYVVITFDFLLPH